MKKYLFLFAIALLFNTSVYAQHWYVDGGYGFVEFDDGTDSISPTNLYIRGGYQFNQYFNLGLETSAVGSDQIDNLSGVEFDVNAVTFYVRGGVPVNESIWIYGQIGRTNTELTAKYQGSEVSEDDNDTMIGFGAEIDFRSSETYPYLALNYSRYNDNDGVDVTAFNLGVGVRF